MPVFLPQTENDQKCAISLHDDVTLVTTYVTKQVTQECVVMIWVVLEDSAAQTPIHLTQNNEFLHKKMKFVRKKTTCMDNICQQNTM